jgi:hypothetical protein
MPGNEACRMPGGALFDIRICRDEALRPRRIVTIRDKPTKERASVFCGNVSCYF